MAAGSYFLMWYDDDKKRTVAKKVAKGAAVFKERFGVAPTKVGVNVATPVGDVAGIEIYAAEYIRPNFFYFGPLRSDKTEGLLKEAPNAD